MQRALLAITPLVLFSLQATVGSVLADDPNVLTEEEKLAGFELLFDGENLHGWQQAGNWKVRDGVISRGAKGGSLRYTKAKVPDDFELRFQWKVGKGSNSGVYYRPGQYEYQILDNAVHRDGKNPRTSAASLYFCVAPSKDLTRPVGEWNQARIICQGTVIQHWLNGEKVIHFDYADSANAEDVERLKIRGASLEARGAHLTLQDHGDPVWYRSFKLRQRKPDEKLDARRVKPQKMTLEALEREQDILKRYSDRKKKAK